METIAVSIINTGNEYSFSGPKNTFVEVTSYLIEQGLLPKSMFHESPSNLKNNSSKNSTENERGEEFDTNPPEASSIDQTLQEKSDFAPIQTLAKNLGVPEGKIREIIDYEGELIEGIPPLFPNVITGYKNRSELQRKVSIILMYLIRVLKGEKSVKSTTLKKLLLKSEVDSGELNKALTSNYAKSLIKKEGRYDYRLLPKGEILAKNIIRELAASNTEVSN